MIVFLLITYSFIFDGIIICLIYLFISFDLFQIAVSLFLLCDFK